MDYSGSGIPIAASADFFKLNVNSPETNSNNCLFECGWVFFSSSFLP